MNCEPNAKPGQRVMVGQANSPHVLPQTPGFAQARFTQLLLNGELFPDLQSLVANVN
jgi:hypothetical protein